MKKCIIIAACLITLLWSNNIYAIGGDGVDNTLEIDDYIGTYYLDRNASYYNAYVKSDKMEIYYDDSGELCKIFNWYMSADDTEPNTYKVVYDFSSIESNAFYATYPHWLYQDGSGEWLGVENTYGYDKYWFNDAGQLTDGEEIWILDSSSAEASGPAATVKNDSQQESSVSRRVTRPQIKTLQLNQDYSYQDPGQEENNNQDNSRVLHFDEQGYLQSVDYSDAYDAYSYSYDWEFSPDGALLGVAYYYDDDAEYLECEVSSENGEFLCVFDGGQFIEVSDLFSFQRPTNLKNITVATKTQYSGNDSYYLAKWDLDGYAYTYSYICCNSDGSQVVKSTYTNDDSGYLVYMDQSNSGGEIRTDYEYDGYLNIAYAVNGVRQTIMYDMVDQDGVQLWYRQNGETELYYSFDSGLLVKKVTHSRGSTVSTTTTYTYEYY